MPVPHDLLADLNITADDFQMRIDKDHDLHKLHKEYNAKDKEVLAADAVATICEGLRQDIVDRGVPEENVTVIPNAVDPDEFAHPAPPDTASSAGARPSSPTRCR